MHELWQVANQSFQQCKYSFCFLIGLIHFYWREKKNNNLADHFALVYLYQLCTDILVFVLYTYKYCQQTICVFGYLETCQPFHHDIDNAFLYNRGYCTLLNHFTTIRNHILRYCYQKPALIRYSLITVLVCTQVYIRYFPFTSSIFPFTSISPLPAASSNRKTQYCVSKEAKQTQYSCLEFCPRSDQITVCFRVKQGNVFSYTFLLRWYQLKHFVNMMTSSNGNIFRVTAQ